MFFSLHHRRPSNLNRKPPTMYKERKKNRIENCLLWKMSLFFLWKSFLFSSAVFQWENFSLFYDARNFFSFSLSFQVRPHFFFRHRWCVSECFWIFFSGFFVLCVEMGLLKRDVGLSWAVIWKRSIDNFAQVYEHNQIKFKWLKF